MKHKYADILIALANGETTQYRSGARWVDATPEDVIGDLLRTVPGIFRVKPKTTNINGYAVPEPMREAPERGTVYWLPSLQHPSAARPLAWHNDGEDNRYLAYGICHFTEEAAKLHAEALVSFTKGEGK